MALNYLQTTSTIVKNDVELYAELSCILNLSPSELWKIISILRKENPELWYSKDHNKKKDKNRVHKAKRKYIGIKDNSIFRRYDGSYRKIDQAWPETKFDPVRIPRVKSSKTKEELELKEIKTIDGFESDWKEGKIEPAEQKNYRGSFQDK